MRRVVLLLVLTLVAGVLFGLWVQPSVAPSVSQSEPVLRASAPVGAAGLRQGKRHREEAVASPGVASSALTVGEAGSVGGFASVAGVGQSVWPISADGIKGAVAEALPKVRACYDAALVADPQLAGRFVVAFTIETVDEVGEVVEADVAGAPTDAPEFEDCLLGAMAELAFDPPDGVTKVTYPFVFGSE